ncbi:Cellular retinoic acid-binding protein 1 [Bagarius yarrelli]|uniref:Cellular retinoic acid-binding protein 1 n=1 Tax=Bagarius yarrelli TaxID=175774 RepID=A0A556TI45_BAGYA|nr:Cellular retinoic acid-binding protein 1 [Bagarius yarrelli]
MHPNFAGTWKMKSSENFDELLKALGVNAMLRKVAGAAAAKPHVEIRQDGDQFYIKTSTSVRTTEINFHIGQEFDEETVDGRKCKSLATWETENKIYCKQTLVDGDGPKTYWSRELKGDELILSEKCAPASLSATKPKPQRADPSYNKLKSFCAFGEFASTAASWMFPLGLGAVAMLSKLNAVERISFPSAASQ